MCIIFFFCCPCIHLALSQTLRFTRNLKVGVLSNIQIFIFSCSNVGFVLEMLNSLYLFFASILLKDPAAFEKVYDKAMIRSLYNEIPHPVLDTKWERNTNN